MTRDEWRRTSGEWRMANDEWWNRFALSFRKIGLGFNIVHGLFVGWVEHPDIFCWVSFLNPTYVPAIFLLSAKPNKMAEDRTVPEKYIGRKQYIYIVQDCFEWQTSNNEWRMIGRRIGPFRHPGCHSHYFLIQRGTLKLEWGYGNFFSQLQIGKWIHGSALSICYACAMKRIE